MYPTLSFSLLLLFVPLLFPATRSDSDSEPFILDDLPPQRHFESGLQAYSHNALDVAAFHFTHVILQLLQLKQEAEHESDPDLDSWLYQCLFNRAICREGLNRLDGAESDYSEAILLDPTEFASRVGRGLLRVRRGRDSDWEDALGDLSFAIERYPEEQEEEESVQLDRNELYLNRGLCFRRLGRYDEAIKDFGVVTRHWKGEVGSERFVGMAYFERGLTYVETGKFDEAISDFTWVVQHVSPKNAFSAHVNRGLLFYDLNRFLEAVSDFTVALDIRPRDPAVLFNRGMSNLALEYYSDAIDDLRMVLSSDPMDVAALHQLGIAYLAVEMYEAAIATFSRIIDEGIDVSSPSLAAAHNSRGHAYFQLKNDSLAEDDFLLAIKIAEEEDSSDSQVQVPRFPRAYFNLANVLFQNGDSELAIKSYSIAIRVSSQSEPEQPNGWSGAKYWSEKVDDEELGSFYFNRGLAYQDLKETEKARSDFEKASSLSPTFEEYQHLLVVVEEEELR